MFRSYAHSMDRYELSQEDPIALFREWMGDAERSEPNDPNAVALATSTGTGVPSVRMVLVKRYDERGFCFFTNAESQKGRELAANAHAAMCFHWKSLRRQVRVDGPVVDLEDSAVDSYFHSRSRRSQLGAAVSAQSRPLASREMLEEQVHRFDDQHPGDVPRPAYWRGYCLVPTHMEFWVDGPDRLHDRFLFTRNGQEWEQHRLYP